MATFRRRGPVPRLYDERGNRLSYPFDRAVPYLLADEPDGQRRAAADLSRGRLVCTATLGPNHIWLPRGLLAKVVALGARGELIERRLARQPLDFAWRATLDGRPTLDENQYGAVAAIVGGQGGLLVAPPGYGKTRMGLGVAAALRQPTLWLTHRKDLCEQVRRDALNYCALPPRAVGLFGMGRNVLGTHLTVCMVQTLASSPQDLAVLSKWAGTVVADEVHHLAATTWLHVMNHLPAAYRVGLTATPDREDGLEGIIRAALGGAFAEITQEMAVESGRIILPEVRMIEAGYQHRDKAGWDNVQRGRAQDASRNWLVGGLGVRELRESRRTVCLVTLKEHAELMGQVLGNQYRVPVAVISGEDQIATRGRAFKGCEQGKVILVCTPLFDEGLNLPSLDSLVMATPDKSSTGLHQRGGRLFRVSPGKGRPRLLDCCDMAVPSLARHAKIRLAFYKRMKWPIAS